MRIHEHSRTILAFAATCLLAAPAADTRPGNGVPARLAVIR